LQNFDFIVSEMYLAINALLKKIEGLIEENNKVQAYATLE